MSQGLVISFFQDIYFYMQKLLILSILIIQLLGDTYIHHAYYRMQARTRRGVRLKLTEHIRQNTEDFLVPIFLCIGAILMIFLVPEDIRIFSYMRYVISILFTLFLPGYALVKLLFLTNKELDMLELLGLSIIFSTMLDILVGAILYYTWELSLGPIIATLTVLTMVFLITSQYLRIKRKTENDN